MLGPNFLGEKLRAYQRKSFITIFKHFVHPKNPTQWFLVSQKLENKQTDRQLVWKGMLRFRFASLIIWMRNEAWKSWNWKKSEIFQEQVVQEIIDACMCLEWPVLAKLCRLHISKKKELLRCKCKCLAINSVSKSSEQ